MKKYRLKQHITITGDKETSVYYTIQEKGFIFWKEVEYKTYVWTGNTTNTIEIRHYNHDIFKTVEEAQDFINERLLKNNIIDYKGEKIEMLYHYNKNSPKVVYVWIGYDINSNIMSRSWNDDLDKLKIDIDKEKNNLVIKYKTKIIKI